MEPTLSDRTMVTVLLSKRVKRKDIIVFESNLVDSGGIRKKLIKRVIGIVMNTKRK